jgi:hypothetical protein
MGIEYETRLGKTISDFERQKILTRFSRLSGTQPVETQSNDMLGLRFLDLELREKWPEDLSIKCSSDTVYVVFHGNTRAKRAEVLLEIVKIIREEVGFEVAFEEL